MVAAVVAGIAASAFAQPAQPPVAAPGETKSIVLRGEQALVIALQVLVAEGRVKEALDLIEGLPPERRAQVDVAFLEAQLRRSAGQARAAVDLYRRLLSRRPDDQRIRLELAQTLFDLKDLRASEHYFRLALSGRLPDADRQLARAYLSRARSLRPWTMTGGLGVAPDSNVNGATSAREVELFGLPFELSEEARRRGGLVVSGYVQGEGSIRLGERSRLVGSAWASASEAGERDFSSEAVGARLGPEFSRADRRWSVAATTERRWYGGQGLYKSLGLSLNGDAARDGGLTVYSAGLTAQHNNYDTLQGRDAWLYGLDLQRTRYLSPRRLWRSSLSVRVNEARDPTESYRLGRVAAGLYQALPLRLGVFLEPSYSVSRYRAPAYFFGVVREDQTAALSARVVKEDYSVWGFAPYVGGEISNSRSTIALYSYTRQRLEIGVTRSF